MSIKILGIESSCDETAAAVLKNDQVLSSELFSQIVLHREYGGVIPEVASRSHLKKINIIVSTALNKANITLDEIDIIAVTTKPGLPGSLLVGLCFAKSLAWSLNKKLIGINHLEGHIFSSHLEHNVPFPYLCIAASGGHTSLYLVESYYKYQLLGQTLDDAAGEAFDKIAKLMGLPYPGGPVIEQLAAKVNFFDFFHYPRTKINSLDFSFSGLKTSVLYDLVKRNSYDMDSKQFLKPNDEILKQEVSSSLLVCITDIFLANIKRAYKAYPQIKAITLVGGVACNKYIRKRLSEFPSECNVLFFTPSPKYCTDNAAMIALVGYYKSQQNQFDDIDLDIF